jgi:hypothetical protein
MAEQEQAQTEQSEQPESQPATVTDLRKLTPSQSHKWRMTGELPASEAESPPAESAEQAASTDAKTEAASETAKPAEKPKPVKNADTRITELLADRAAERTARERAENEIARLRDRLEALEASKDAKAESSPASSKSPVERFKNHPDAPRLDDFENYEDFLDERAAFIADQLYQERQRNAAAEEQSKQYRSGVERMVTDFVSRMDAADKADPDWQGRVRPDLINGIKPAFAVGPKEPVRAENVAMAEVVKSEYPSELLLHFSTPEGEKEWAEMVASPDPATLLRRFARIEARFEKREATGKAPVKTVSTAPAPPTKLSGNPQESADAVESALKSGNYAAYRARLNERELAQRR